LVSERPVVAYQMHPYSGATSYLTSATLLIPTEAWGKNHLVTTPTETAMLGVFAIAVASESDTTVSFRPRAVATAAGAGVEAAAVGSTVRVKLNAGEFVRFSTSNGSEGGFFMAVQKGLSGSSLTADKPVGVFGGAQCYWEPDYETKACDSAHQQALPLSALGY
jgi:hypothetical protein